MPDKIVDDVIQGFEVENGVPHLISTNIQVIEGVRFILHCSRMVDKEYKTGFLQQIAVYRVQILQS